MSRGAWTGATVCCLVALAAVLTASAWTGPVRWTPDGLLYQAMAQEIGGDDAQAARDDLLLHRHRGSVAETLGYRLNPTWIDYQAGIMRRRWGVPVLAAAVSPAFGDRSLLVISLACYAALGPALFFLLRRRFTAGTSVVVSIAALLLPPLSFWAGFPLIDLPALLLLTLALLAGTVAVERGGRCIVLWAGMMLLYGFTRESALVPALASCWLALRMRTRRSVAIAVTGIVAVLPAPLLFGSHVRTTLAFAFSGNNVPSDASWGYIADHYWPYLRWMLENDVPSHARPTATVAIWLAVILLLVHPRRLQWRNARAFLLVALLTLFALLLIGSAVGLVADTGIPTGLVLGLGLVLLVPVPGLDSYVELMRGSALAGLAFLLVNPQWTAFRYELVLLPAAAAGYAAALEAPLAAVAAHATRIAHLTASRPPAWKVSDTSKGV